MKRKHRLKSGLLCFSLLLGLLPTTVFATNTSPTEIRWVAMDFRDGIKDVSGDGYSWEKSTKTLTLDEFDGIVYDGTRENSAAILLPADSTIVLNGENTLVTESDSCRGIYSEGGKLTVEGKGTLDMDIESSGGSGFYLDNGGSVSFEGRVQLDVETEGNVIYIYNASGNSPLISISKNARIAFSDELGEKAIYVVRKNSATSSENWFNYDEEFDRNKGIVYLVVALPVTKEDTAIVEEAALALDHYGITIGKNEITKNGATVYTGDVPAYLSNGYTMLPLRALTNALGQEADIQWNAVSKVITVDINGNSYRILASQNILMKGDESIALSAPVEVKDGRTFLSLRDWMTILEIPSAQVSWNPDAKTVDLEY